MFEEEKECDGSEIFQGRLATIAECANECIGKASMFGFATDDFGGNRCFDDGCNCICETSAKEDGTCDMVPNISYRLYKFKTPGNHGLISNTSQWQTLFLVYLMYFFNQNIDWTLVSEKKECGGSEIYQQHQNSISHCSNECRGKASMFIFGTNDFGQNRCYEDGCICVCETGAKDDGTCDMVSHDGYNLYKFKTRGNDLFQWFI